MSGSDDAESDPNEFDGITTGVIVGIDIGMTHTGVAVCAYDNVAHQKPKVIQDWPGTTAVANKVPTRIAYRAGFSRLDSWGFACPDFEEIRAGMAMIDLFKFRLEHVITGGVERHGDVMVEREDVKKWYRDFLAALYVHIGDYLKSKQNVEFEEGTVPVDYVFSIPTLWRTNHELVSAFMEAVKAAGFCSGNVTMELTEGEAAAVFTATIRDRKLKKDDAFIVCDAGGETTDMCSLRVVRAMEEGGAIEFELLDQPKAIHVGSVRIDELFEEKAREYLASLNIDHDTVQRLAHRMRKGDFQQLKIRFGTPLILQTMMIDVGGGFSEVMELPYAELREMFDKQFQDIVEFIDNEVRLLQSIRPQPKLSYLFLAGGLASSTYLQDKIVSHYKELEVVFATNTYDLPLAVCKGLVIDRLQHFTDQASVIPIKASSASYGLLCWEVYGKKHTGQQAVKNRIDGHKYAENQIDWLVVRDPMTREGEPVKRRYRRVVEQGSETNKWGFAVVCSRAPPDKLPSFLDVHANAAVICYVIWEPAPGKEGIGTLKRKMWVGKKYCLVEYELTAIIALGRLKFTSKIVGLTASSDEEEDLTVRWPDEEVVASEERCGLIKGPHAADKETPKTKDVTKS